MKTYIHLLLFMITSFPAYAAVKDSLVLKNRDIIVGELKVMDKGILTIETDYSDDDFTIEWDKVKEIYTRSSFLMTLDDGTRTNGYLHSITGTDSVMIKSIYGDTIYTRMIDVVFLKGVKSKFLSRLDASIDAGVTITKANNLRQYNMSSALGYLANRWEASVTYSDNRSIQDSAAATKRTEGNAGFKYFLPHDWFLNTSLNFLANTEQALKLRTTGKVGGGKFLLHTNKAYWGAGTGLSLNMEKFTNETPNRNSLEVYAATELNLFDLKDVDLLSNLYVYRSLTESKRWRADFNFNLKIDLPLEFYIKPGITLNYDNQPAIVGNETDYVITFAVGWEL